MRAMGILNNDFKKNSGVISAIEYQNRLARDSVKSFSPGVLVVCTLFPICFTTCFFLYLLMKNEREKANPFLPKECNSADKQMITTKDL